MSFPERLQYLREQKGLTETQLGQIFNLSGSAIRLYEKGRLEVSLDLLNKLAEYFDVPPRYLLGTLFPNLPPEEALNSYKIVSELKRTRSKEQSKPRADDTQAGPAHRPATATLSELKYVPAPQDNTGSGQPALLVPVYKKLSASESTFRDQDIEFFWPLTNRIIKAFGDDPGSYFFLRVQDNSMTPTLQNQEIVLVRKQNRVENGDIAVLSCNQEPPVIARYAINNHVCSIRFDNSSFGSRENNALQCRIIGKVIWKTTAPSKGD